MKRKKRSNVVRERLITKLLRAQDGKYGRTYPLSLVGRICMLQDIPDENERKWLGDELIRLVQTGDTKTLRYIAEARDRFLKDAREVFNRKRYDRLRAYLRVYDRGGRPPEIRELFKPSGDLKKDMSEERSIRKLLDDVELPYTRVPTGRPKGVKDSRNSERLRRLRSLLLR
jgi:hypothetical protein